MRVNRVAIDNACFDHFSESSICSIASCVHGRLVWVLSQNNALAIAIVDDIDKFCTDIFELAAH